MTERARSPRRAHILASINRIGDNGSASQDIASALSSFSEAAEGQTGAQGAAEPHTTRFRFKSKPSRRHGSRSRSRSPASAGHGDSKRHHRERGEPRRHRKKLLRRPASPAELESEDPFAPAPLSPDAAFRASLFDAMADDEGAAYWEGVYGQPVHVYARDAPDAATKGGPLEDMDDEEYAAYVRRRMWEKTHAGLLEERERRAAAAATQREEEKERARILREVERSLRKGEERRSRAAAEGRWQRYSHAWADWDGAAEGVAWPVESGRREDIGDESVRDFFVRGLGLAEVGEKAFAAALKEERVRWHPDKMQQRLKGAMDDAMKRDFTAIFQVIDKLWGDTRPKA
jgi:hypothetical protein